MDKHRAATPLISPIRHVCYLSTDPPSGANGAVDEVHPHPNPLVISRLRDAQAIIYGAGSLYTSICPSLIVRG